MQILLTNTGREAHAAGTSSRAEQRTCGVAAASAAVCAAARSWAAAWAAMGMVTTLRRRQRRELHAPAPTGPVVIVAPRGRPVFLLFFVKSVGMGLGLRRNTRVSVARGDRSKPGPSRCSARPAQGAAGAATAAARWGAQLWAVGKGKMDRGAAISHCNARNKPVKKSERSERPGRSLTRQVRRGAPRSAHAQQ